ncbi:MAG: hypothetical protein B6244_12780 [Candidatus Cloacimonetes bacterium 4572_55]|nr:MAG: hypothetical protein B6244_12780 [Candidatus Cloacimonetes bacterium 4572_55]
MNHKRVIRYIFFSFLLVFAGFSTPQAQDIIEDLIDSEEATDQDVEYYEELEKFLDDPIDLNQTDEKELARLPGLTQPLIRAILKYREEIGSFSSKKELKQAPGVTNELYQQIRPFVTARKKKPRERALRIVHRLRYSSRDPNEDEFDSFYKLYQRTQAIYKEWLTLGFLTEKDAGETDFDDLQLWYLSVKNHALPVQGVIGNYKVECGQGLLFSPQAGMFKGGEVVTGTKKRHASIRPYSSTNEVSSFYGAGFEGEWGRLSLILFGSKAKLDATLNEDGAIQSIYTTGLHRTDTEKAKKDRLTETLYGGHARLRLDENSSIGATYYQSEFDEKIDPNDDYYRFRGDELSGVGVDADLYFKQVNLFGEWARSMDHGSAWVVGAGLNVGQVQFSALMRDYDPDFYTFHSYGFAFFRYPYSMNSNLPEDGDEYYTQLEIPLSKSIKWTLRFRSKEKTESPTKKKYRSQIDWQPVKTYRLRIRYEHARTADKEDGQLLYGDLQFKPDKRLLAYIRLLFFDTESSNAAVYAFENDLPGVLKTSYFSDRGRRWYVAAKYKFHEKSYLSMKFGQKTKYEPTTDQANVQSVVRETSTDWSCQLDFMF